ncbi:hypothetical protein GCM10009530_08590 [Microbispora corallina]|uniref:Uncharacterized protein n=1 Tax=Microbispora corallina TaxID=83302 RepID=A0ABQ4FVL4_9ACTN|nr:hypothetical protein [Microbispora corallina]GIH38822.1 hypothetical protein Mco01_18220 [Microbispora corallina]
MTQFETSTRPGALGLRVGEVVEVRDAEEILATLDEKGELDSLPFMPEMLRFCGRRLTVHKVAHKLCDTMTGSGMRRMRDAVHLVDARCDGSAHGGCQTSCSLYWKEAWLRRVDPDEPAPDAAPDAAPVPAPGRSLPILEVNTRREPGEDGETRYRCQATELLRAAPEPLPFRDLSQYVTDVRVGNAGVLATLRTVFFGLFNRFQRISRRLPSWMRFRDGMEWGFVAPGPNTATPTAETGLQPGDLVRVKPRDAIVATLNNGRLNRGMGFEEEMARYCGREARVRARVERCIDEKTGRMLQMKSPCIILDGVVCAGVYKANCPREFVPFWREIWLERVGERG